MTGQLHYHSENEMPKMGKDSFVKQGKTTSTMGKPSTRTTIVPRKIKYKELISLAKHDFVPQIPFVPLPDLPVKTLYRMLQYDELAEDMKLRYPTKGDGLAYSVLLMDYRSKQKPRPRLRIITPERYGSAIAKSNFLAYDGMATSANGREYHKLSTFNVRATRRLMMRRRNIMRAMRV